MITFNIKKFIALIGTENRLMQLFYDKAEAEGLEPNFDIYHILEGKETPSEKEIEIMKGIFEFNIIGTAYEKDYQTADIDFPAKIAKRNEERRSGTKNNKHLNN